MKKLILIKHSLPDIKTELPPPCWHLSDEGKKNSSTLAGKLKAYNPKRLFCSTEPKAIETAEIIATYLGQTFESIAGLHEHERNTVGFLPKNRV